MNDFILSLMMGAMASTGSVLPFWTTANVNGLLNDNSLAVASLSAYSQYDTTKTFQYRFGGSLVGGCDYPCSSSDNAGGSGAADFRLMVDELYGSIRWNVLSLDLGMKHQNVDFLAGGTLLGNSTSLGSLSTTGGHLMWSSNARTMPGYAFNLDPLAIPFTGGHLWIYGSYGDYMTIDDRYCQDALVHSMKAFLRIDFLKRFSLHLGLDHAAVWGGNGEHSTVKPTFGNYLRMATGRAAGKDGSDNDRAYVIGDHLGAELIKLEYDGDWFKVTAQHEIPYTDGSGMGFMNFPDGVNTVHFGWKDKKRWVSDILYEYGYTMYQSGSEYTEKVIYDEDGNVVGKTGITTGGDNYFNNGEYLDGWVHCGRTIGYPLFFTEERSDDGYVLGVRNNRLRSHHLAVAGMFAGKAPYKLMLTYSRNYGTYGRPYAGESAWQKPWGTVVETPLRQFMASFTGEIPLIKGLSLSYGLYADYGELLENQVGFSVGARYTLPVR